MEIFVGGEHSTIEYLQACVLVAYLAIMIFVVVSRADSPDAGFMIAATFIGLLVLMVGRELSYGKYHGIPHSLRTTMRIISIVAVLLFWGAMYWVLRRQWRDLFRQALQLLSNCRVLIVATVTILVLSQILDKDWIYAIRPPELAQALEEGLEFVAYACLGLLFRRLLSRPLSVMPPASAEPRH